MNNSSKGCYSNNYYYHYCCSLHHRPYMNHYVSINNLQNVYNRINLSILGYTVNDNHRRVIYFFDVVIIFFLIQVYKIKVLSNVEKILYSYTKSTSFKVGYYGFRVYSQRQMLLCFLFYFYFHLENKTYSYIRE